MTVAPQHPAVARHLYLPCCLDIFSTLQRKNGLHLCMSDSLMLALKARGLHFWWYRSRCSDPDLAAVQSIKGPCIVIIMTNYLLTYFFYALGSRLEFRVALANYKCLLPRSHLVGLRQFKVVLRVALSIRPVPHRCPIFKSLISIVEPL